MPRTDPSSVDIARSRSVSFARPETASRQLVHGDRSAVPVGPGRPAIAEPNFALHGRADGVNGYPIQLSKVQPPILRDETLARDRLLDWLHAKIHHRVVLVVAEAGYGKTTLLADFSRRTRITTLWYRLDETDRDWVSFLNHLVAAGREIDPAFAPSTASLLGEVAAVAGPGREAVVGSLCREMQGLTDGAAVILDDYHLIDESEDARSVMTRLLAAAPERVTFVISSRQPPSLRLGRLRAQGEVVELSTEDLRFDTSETERLFRDSYRQPLDADVLEVLSNRTEGWVASLQLVQAAIRDRSAGEIRSFVRNLSGAYGELYDFLAEEVIGELPDETQSFLMRTSLLNSLDPSLAAVVAGISVDNVRREAESAARAGLLLRRGTRSARTHTYHPLVKEFLRDRLRREIGTKEVSRLHLEVARVAEGVDWRTACYHFAEAGDAIGVWRVIDTAVREIMGAGDFAAAGILLDRYPPDRASSSVEIIKSRLEYRKGDVAAALVRARSAHELGRDSDAALANLLSLEWAAGNIGHSLTHARTLSARTSDPQLKAIGDATMAIHGAGPNLDFRQIVSNLRDLGVRQLDAGHRHYAGISFLNAAALAATVGDAQHAVSDAERALEILLSSSRGAEVASARMARAWGLAHLGRLEEARLEFASATSEGHPIVRVECLVEMADLECWYGDANRAEELLADAEPHAVSRGALHAVFRLARAQLGLRKSDPRAARADLEHLNAVDVARWPGLSSRRLALEAHAAILAGDPNVGGTIDEAEASARRVGAVFWSQYVRALAHTVETAQPPSEAVLSGTELRPYLSVHAERWVPKLPESAALLAAAHAEAELRPERWRPCLRFSVDNGPQDVASTAALILDVVGEAGDVRRLRRFSRTLRKREFAGLGRTLARRLALPVFVDDLGRVSLQVGKHATAGTEVRRKVLSLLCFLLSRPAMSATRDQVVDALWPNLDPEVALNSLNQTIYFLRRVFEPAFDDEVSPRYIHHDSDILWLDPALVNARSRDCWELVRLATALPSPDTVDRLADTYTGRFALDFAYEEWSEPYRESLHAAYLQLLEASVRADTASGHYDRAITLARRVVAIDPEAEGLEACLVRLYRLTGAHAAAAEQYGHYAAQLRDYLGVEPPPLESL